MYEGHVCTGQIMNSQTFGGLRYLLKPNLHPPTAESSLAVVLAELSTALLAASPACATEPTAGLQLLLDEILFSQPNPDHPPLPFVDLSSPPPPCVFCNGKLHRVCGSLCGAAAVSCGE